MITQRWPQRLGRALVRVAKPAVDRYPTLARLYRDMRARRRLNEEPVETPLGFKFAGSAVMARGEFEPDEAALVSRILPEVDLFINVGANVGYYCCLALKHGVSTIAFEPMAGNLHYLYRNIQANGWSERVEIFPVALSARSGLTSIYGEGTGASLIRGWAGTPSHYHTIVPTNTLDILLAGRIDGRRSLILVDVEGAEYDVLTGATEVLNARPKPIWLVEISIDRHQPNGARIAPNLRSTFARFWQAGYEAVTADRRLRPVAKLDLDAMEQEQRNTVGTHNFLFLERGHRIP
jgi:FkbM family methyltransferase